MSGATLNGATVLAGSLTLPRRGVWLAELELDGDTAPTGAAVLSVPREGAAPDQFIGTVVHALALNGRVCVQLAGGKAALWSKAIPARQFVGSPMVTLDELLRDLARETGETFAPAPSKQLERWARAHGVGAQALGLLTRELDLEWRLRPDGTVEVLEETWPQVTESYELLDADDLARIVDVAPAGARILPGQSLGATRIERVIYSLGGSLRAALYYGPGGAEAFRRAVQAVLADPVWDQSHGAEVIVQHADGTIDVLVDDERIVQATKVPVRVGGPETRVVLEKGDRVSLVFQDGNPRRPVVCGVDLDPAAARGVARFNDTVAVGTLTLAVASGVLSGAYTPPGGTPMPVVSGQPITLSGAIATASSRNLIG
jgi:hypothetical protein